MPRLPRQSFMRSVIPTSIFNIQYLIFSIFFLVLTSSLQAQQTTVTGTVTDASNGDAMPFVTVAVAGTTNAINTGMDGKYLLQNVSVCV